jgi:uncharacterized protein
MVNRVIFRRPIRAVTTWPDAAGWRSCGVVACLALVGIAAVAGLSGLVRWQPDTGDWPMRLGTILLVPAFSEELVFRGFLTPTRGEGRHDRWWLVGGVVVFVLWHIVEARTFLPGASHLFLRPDFLLCAGMLGAACAVMRYRTASIWPGVFLHAATVFAWQMFLGGPGFARLTTA